MSEHDEQVSFFEWAGWNEPGYPDLGFMFAIPNGGKRKHGWWEKTEGLKSGVWDIFLAVPTDEHPGLFVEMKFGKNPLTPNQKIWRAKFIEKGYKTAVCYSWIEAKNAVIDYLGLNISKEN